MKRVGQMKMEDPESDCRSEMLRDPPETRRDTPNADGWELVLTCFLDEILHTLPPSEPSFLFALTQIEPCFSSDAS